MINLDFWLRGLTLLLIIIRESYWLIMQKKAEAEKPKAKVLDIKRLFKRAFFRGMLILLGLQLLGLDILPYPHNSVLQLLGFALVVISFIISILGRKELGTNWTGAAEYQVKKKQVLITTGIYRYIRHPMYIGLGISLIGGQLVAESYLVVIFVIIAFFGGYKQGKREEKLLLTHFGKEYEVYMKKSKMLIPFIF